MIVTLHHEEKSMSQIDKEIGVSKNTISIWCQRAREGELEEALQVKKVPGCPRKTTEKDDKYLQRLVKNNPSITSKELKQENT